MDETLCLEVWDRLIQGRSLDGLQLGRREGRVDLRGLNLPAPIVWRKYRFQKKIIAEIDPAATLHDAKCHDLDFSGSRLDGLRLHGCEFVNCRFDGCHLCDVRIWASTFSQCSFRGAKLGGAMLGAVDNGRRNAFTDVDFSTADLRATKYQAAAFVRCDFGNAKLENIDFQTSTFVDCRFEGELRDVLFYRRAFGGDSWPENEMINVDLSRTELHDVGFRNLSLERVKLPENPRHIIISDAADKLDKITSQLEQAGDPAARKLIAFLGITRKWIPSSQARAVINVEDLVETLGAETAQRLNGILRPDAGAQ